MVPYSVFVGNTPFLEQPFCQSLPFYGKVPLGKAPLFKKVLKSQPSTLVIKGVRVGGIQLDRNHLIFTCSKSTTETVEQSGETLEQSQLT